MPRRYAITPAPLILAVSGFAAAMLSAQSAGHPRSEQELRAFYLRACARCHGEDGSGFSSDGKKLQGRGFTSDKRIREATDQELVKVIRRGAVFGLIMPSFKKDLSEEEALILVRDILKKAQKGVPIHTPVQPPQVARTSAIPR